MNVNFKDGATSVFGEITNLAMTKCGHYTFSPTVPCQKNHNWNSSKINVTLPLQSNDERGKMTRKHASTCACSK